MKVKLIVRATKKEDKKNILGNEYLFENEESISIGRGAPNNVPLTDSDRTVSRNHAKLTVSSSGYVLNDLNSKNYSYVNNERVTVGLPRELLDGDLIKLGDFVFEYSLLQESQDLDRTVIDFIPSVPDYSRDNPFIDAAKDLKNAWEQLIKVYDNQQLGDKKEYLTHAIKGNLLNIDDHFVVQMCLNMISDTQVSEATHLPAIEKLNANDSSVNKDVFIHKPINNPLSTLPTSQQDELLEVLLTSLKKVIQVPHDFRGEFVGNTMWADEELEFFIQKDNETIKGVLFHDSMDSASFDKKMKVLEKAVENIKVHQLGMMEGYKSVVKEGIGQVLNEINIEEIERKYDELNPIQKIQSALISKGSLSELKEKIDFLKESDWVVLEQRLFRPIFIRAYMSTTSLKD